MDAPKRAQTGPRRPIKVVRIISRLNIGGPAIHVSLLTRAMSQQEFHCMLVCGAADATEGSMVDDVRADGVSPILISGLRGEASLRWNDLAALFRLYALLRRERPQIVHTHTGKAGALGRVAAWLAGVPIIVHTYHGHVLHGYYGKIKTTLLRAMERILAAHSGRLIAVSEQVKQDLVSYRVAAPAKISVIPLGLDLERFMMAKNCQGAFRRQWGLNGKSVLVGIVGRIVPIKNHRLFLEAAARVTANQPLCRFVVVGDGVLRGATEQYAKELGIGNRVVFTGWLKDLPAVYADLDVLVVSSDNEGTPVAAIEAMAAGKPVVATRVGGMADLIEDGRTGYLTVPGDAKSLADAIVRAVSGPEKAAAIGEAARDAVRERFASARLVHDIESLYRDLLQPEQERASTGEETKHSQRIDWAAGAGKDDRRWAQREADPKTYNPRAAEVPPAEAG